MSEVLDPLELRTQFAERVLAHDYSLGPLLILAGPGTGKTYSLVETIRQRANEGLSLNDFFEATLTNAAAVDFLSAAHKRISEDFSASSTLHFRAKGLLHTHAEVAGLSPGFTVIDDNCEHMILGDLAAQLQMETTALAAALRSHRKEVASAAQVQSGFGSAYLRIQAFYSALDWFDVMRLACKLLADNPPVRDYESSRFEYLLIDEYQDLNPSDQLFIELLLNGRQTLLAVGDDDQSIYSGRFADASGITDFNGRYEDAEIIQLPVTSRIPTAVINASYRLISNNVGRAPKNELVPLAETDDRAGGGIVISVNTRSGKAEAQFIHDAILRLLELGTPPEAILVLCSCRALGLELMGRIQDMDEAERIPIWNQLASDEVSSSAEYAWVQLLRLLAKHDDNLAARVVVDMVAGGHVNEVRRLVLHAMESRITIWAVLGDDEFLETLVSTSAGLRDLRQSIEALDPQLSVRERASELVNGLPALAGLRQFQVIADEGAENAEGDPAESALQQGIRFITFHSSKGLEADFVFIPFLEEDLSLPGADDEERRRLLYVALTRAKVGVAISWAWSRNTASRFKCSGTGGPITHRQPSHLIAECGIPHSLLPAWQNGSAPDLAVELLAQRAGAIYS
jgi:DNA helicase-2/ATP-dependent DNA helicase PcrA